MKINLLNKINGWFDLEFTRNSKYAWPLSMNIAEYVFQHASAFTNFQELFEAWKVLPSDDIPENNLIRNENFSLVYTNKQFNTNGNLIDDQLILNQIKQSPVFHWNYDQVICSATFFIFDFNLRTKGTLSPSIWFQLINSLALLDSKNRLKVLNVIQKNGFFYFNPKSAIQGANQYFNLHKEISIFFNLVKEPRETLDCILKLLKIEDCQIDLLTNYALTHKSLYTISDFLKSYTFLEGKLLTLNDLEFILKNVDLSSEKQDIIIQKIIDQLETFSPFDILSTSENYHFSFTLQILSYYEESPKKKQQLLINQELFDTINSLIPQDKLYDSKKLFYTIITYPPIELVQQYLTELSQEELDDFYNIVFKKHSFTSIITKINVLGCLALIIVVWFFGSRASGTPISIKATLGQSAQPMSQQSQVTSRLHYSSAKASKLILPTTNLSYSDKVVFPRLPNRKVNLFIEKSVNGKLKISLFGNWGPHEIVKNLKTHLVHLFKKGDITLNEIAGFLENPENYTFIEYESDHLAPASLTSRVLIPRRLAVAIATQPHRNASRTNQNNANNSDFTRKYLLKDIEQAEMPVGDLYAQQVKASFDRMSGDSDFMVDPSLNQPDFLFLEQSSRAIEHFKNQVGTSLRGLDLPDKYSVEFSEVVALIHSIAADASFIHELALVQYSNLGVLDGQNLLVDFSLRQKHINGYRHYIGVDSTAAQFLDREQTHACGALVNSLQLLRDLRGRDMTVSEVKLYYSVLNECIKISNQTPAKWDQEIRDEQARNTFGIHKAMGKQGRFYHKKRIK